MCCTPHNVKTTAPAAHWNTCFHFSVQGSCYFLIPFQVFPTYHIYPSTAPHVAYMQPKANAPSFFMADELRQVFFIFSFVPLIAQHPSFLPLYSSMSHWFVFVLQELINRHLITMAQIDHSENTGSCFTTYKKKKTFWILNNQKLINAFYLNNLFLKHLSVHLVFLFELTVSFFGRRTVWGGQLPQPVSPRASPSTKPHAKDRQLQLHHLLLQGSEQQGRPALLPEADTGWENCSRAGIMFYLN